MQYLYSRSLRTTPKIENLILFATSWEILGVRNELLRSSFDKGDLFLKNSLLCEEFYDYYF